MEERMSKPAAAEGAAVEMETASAQIERSVPRLPKLTSQTAVDLQQAVTEGLGNL